MLQNMNTNVVTSKVEMYDEAPQNPLVPAADSDPFLDEDGADHWDRQAVGGTSQMVLADDAAPQYRLVMANDSNNPLLA
jgi:hypothetical protein